MAQVKPSYIALIFVLIRGIVDVENVCIRCHILCQDMCNCEKISIPKFLSFVAGVSRPASPIAAACTNNIRIICIVVMLGGI